MYINTTTLTQHTESEIRELNPNTSFGSPFIAPEGYKVVFASPKPSYDSITQIVVEVEPELTNKGTWEQRWEVLELFETEAEKTAAIAADAEAKRIASIPVSVSPRQIRQALTAAGLRTQIETAVAASDQDTKDWWEFATTFERAHPMVIGMATELGITTTELDDLFILAASL